MKGFIFDVDGTLTPSRGKIDDNFQRWFLEFCYSHHVYLVTGSDYPKTVEQLGTTICENVIRVYNCNGNDVWSQGKNINTNYWVLPEEAHDWLSGQLVSSEFPLRTGLHFEHRPGMVNFSIVGRNADAIERKAYVKWDNETKERQNIANKFNNHFVNLTATVGGETGLDIAPKGADKGQILKDFEFDNIRLLFFGDRMDEKGNDYPLAKLILDNKLGECYNIQNWENTWNLLQNYVD